MRRRYVARLNMRRALICGSLLVLAVASSFAPLRPLAPLRPRSAGGRPRASGDGAEVVEVELARPLGVTVQEVRGAVVVQSCAPRAAAAGVAPGDEIVGVSAVFGDKVWDTRAAGLDRVEALIRNREGDAVTLRLSRGGRRGAPADAGDDFADDDVDTATFRGIFADEAAGGGGGDDGDDAGMDAVVGHLFGDELAGLEPG